MTDNAIPIERGVPIPPRPRPANARYPFNDLQIGDSFAVPAEVSPNAMRATARFHAKHKGREFKVRKSGDGWRVWRTA